MAVHIIVWSVVHVSSTSTYVLLALNGRLTTVIVITINKEDFSISDLIPPGPIQYQLQNQFPRWWMGAHILMKNTKIHECVTTSRRLGIQDE